jgi:beta-mannosidase
VWRAATADETLRRAYPDLDYRDDAWEMVAVPGHWASYPAFSGTAGPVLYRRRFETPPPPGPGPGRTWLVLDGVFSAGDVWLDGAYLGDTEGYFVPHAFDVTGPLAARHEHVLAVEVACRADGDEAGARGTGARRSLLGAFAPGAGRPNPGGLWRPVHLEQTGPVRIAHLRVRVTDVTDGAATVAVRAVLDSAEATSVLLRTTVGPAGAADEDEDEVEVDDRRRWPLARGENRVEWNVVVPRPRRWWPRSLGDQPLYDLRLGVLVPGDGRADRTLSDERSCRLGLRTVAADDWTFTVNGERLFLKGAAQGPTRHLLAEAGAGDLARDVRLALDAGLDFLRLRAHVSRPELYDAADAAGLLLWQDMPVQGRQHRAVRRQARRQARELVDLLAHRPSVLVWCAHDEPEPLAAARPRADRWGTRGRLAARTLAAHAVPSWNRAVLDRSVRAELTASDGTRPVVAHAGVLPHPPAFPGTDAHLSFGWYHHDERDLPAALHLWPRLARFVGGFGAPAVPGEAGFLEPARWPDLDWGRAEAEHGVEKDVFDRVVPPAAFATFAAWQWATQEHQARVVRHHVETLRRLKYRPCGGFALAAFADGSPGVSAAVLDHLRRPKPALAALRAACAPVLVVADRPPALVRPGGALALDIHVINDRHIALDDMMVDAYLRWGDSARPSAPPPSGSTTTQHRWRWRGDVPPDDCSRIGTIQALAPPARGPLVLDLVLSPAGDPATVVAANRYTTTVGPA